MHSLTAPEIIQVIRACSEHAVTQFRAGDIEITFSGYKPPIAQVPTQPADLAQALQEARDWMEQSIPPSPFPPEALEV